MNTRPTVEKPIWRSVSDEGLPRANSNVVMAWEGRAVMQGKFFGTATTLSGFAVDKGSHYVGKVGVTHWCYTRDLLKQIGAKR